MRRVVGLAVVVGVPAWGQVAQAVPISWTLASVMFDDGGTASGSFVFDADTSVYSLIGITTTAGTTLTSGTTYTDEHPFYVGGSLQSLVMLDSLPAALGVRALQLPFLVPLTNAGGTVTLGGLTGFGEGICGAVIAFCSSVSASLPFRFISGEVVGTQASVPEPSTLLLLGTGLAMVGVRYRRRKK